jgi:hypothetical protein
MRSSQWQFARTLICGLTALSLVSACSKIASDATPTSSTAMEQASNVRCARGLNRIELVGGIEDGFAATGAEPARIRPARLPNAYLEAVAQAQSGPMLLRDYDEAGQDRTLIDHFDVPRGIVSGSLIVGIQTTAGSDNDNIKLGNLNENDFAEHYARVDSFYHTVGKYAAKPSDDAGKKSEQTHILAIPLETLEANSRSLFKGDFLRYLNRADRSDSIDFEVEDDTRVDVAILVLCQEPQVARGTSFAEFRAKFIAPNTSFLSCFLDKTQAPCNPFQGDQLCTAALPVACYKPGQNVPTGLTEAGLGEAYGAGGEIRMTRPVPGKSLATLADANGYCVSQFGAGWRVLDYHDGAGGAIITNSAIPPKTRGLVNVRDQPYANCWDRGTAK